LATSSAEYNFTRLERVIYGARRIESLGRELERHGCRRALVVTGATLGRSKLLEGVTGAAGAMLAGVFTGTAQHAPSATIDALVAEARRVTADSFVSFGGGSPIDSAKAAAMALMGGGGPRAIGASTTRPPADAPAITHLAVPTTLSAAEWTPFGGVTNEATREKGGVGDPRLQPRTVILDPELTVETPAWLWASTAMRALDHAVEGAYSARHQALTDLLATRAIALLREHLKPSMQGGADELEHRLQCQLAAWFSIFGALNTRLGVSHALGHQIGPYWNVPHGVTSCITLPHVMRFMAAVAPERFGPIADGFGIPFGAHNPRAAALECAERAAQFIGGFEVPTRLRDVGVPREEIGRIAGAVLHEISRSDAVGRPIEERDLLALLDAAY
jgi:alcohol dehydrogenase